MGQFPEKKQVDEEIAPGAERMREATPLVPGKIGETEQIVERLGVFAGVQNLSEHFGYKLLVMLFCTQHLMKGFCSAFIYPCYQYLFAAYNVGASQIGIFSGVIMLPWSMKPIIGLISDVAPIFGYNKAPYMLLATVAGLICTGAIGVVPQDHLSITALVCCLFVIQLMYSVNDLLIEAKYAEKMRDKPEHGPALMTYVWFGLNVGGFVATLFIGSVLTEWGPKFPFVLCFLPTSFILVPLLRNYLEETCRSQEEIVEERKKFMAEPETCFLCVLMLIGTILLTFLGIFYAEPWINAAAALVVSLIMLVSFSVLLRPMIAKVNAFFLVQSSMTFSISGATFYFYTDTAEQYPEGPHFSMQFYTTVLGVVSTVFTLLGIWSYQRYASKWSYRSLLMVSNLLFSALSMLDVVMFKRWNLTLGISDHFFVLGSASFQYVIYQWQWMPGVVINAQLCPAGMEATMYALLAGCHNLGIAVAYSFGAYLLQVLRCQPRGAVGESSQFDNLWMASVVATIMPMFTLVALPWLIPDAKQTDKLLDDTDRDATAGSLWRQWIGGK